VSDGLAALRALRAGIDSHLAIVTGSGRSSAEHPGFRWVNIMLGNLKNALTGTYHAFKFAKYAPRYLADFQYRFSRRYNLRSILPRLLPAAATTKPWTGRQLRVAELSSSSREPPPKALTQPYVRLSPYTALPVQPFDVLNGFVV